MTFDEALDQLEPRTIWSSEMRDLLEQLRQEYAPTVKMTKEQYKGLLFEGKGRETAHKNFVFLHEIQKLNDAYISINILMNVFAHPETIKIVDE